MKTYWLKTINTLARCLIGIFLFASCQKEEPAGGGTQVDVPLSITLGGVRGYSSGLPETLAIDTRATTPMTTGTRFRVVALQRNRIAAQADYTVTASGVSADGIAMQLLPGKYKFVAYSFNTTTALSVLNNEGVVPVTNVTDFLFAQDVEEFREVGAEPVSLSFTFVPQRARVRVEMENFELGTSITSPGTVKLTGSFYTGASFSLVGGMLFGYTGAASSYTFTFSDVAGVTRASNSVYVLPSSGTSTVSIAGATVLGYLPYSGSGTLPAFLPGKEYVYMQSLGVTEITGLSGANCFIVTKAGRYAINATIKGNGKQVRSVATTGVAADVPATAEGINVDITVGDYAELLWETFNTTTTPTADNPVVKDISYNAFTKQIMFTATANEGNAVIALKDMRDGILWSWHIWRTNSTPMTRTLNALTATSGTTFDATGTTTLSGLQIMDRNLGALSASGDASSMGMLYQWGRKDPFTGSASLSSEVAMAVRGEAIRIVSTDALTTPDRAAENPTIFFKNNGDWMNSRNDNLWGTPMTNTVKIYNGSSTFTYNSNAGSKTIYDPCPPGWHVAPGYAFANASVSNGNLFKEGYPFSIGGGTTWFPAAGSRTGSDGSLYLVGTWGEYWTSSPNATNTSNGSVLHFLGGGVFPANSYSRSTGRSVRCSKE